MDKIAEKINEIIDIELEEILRFKENHDQGKLIAAIEMFFKTKGKIIVIGMGKSGHIGKKIAATLASTGTTSFFIHPTEALHGDLGMISSDDCCLLLSHSGETEELLKIIPILNKFSVKKVSITANDESSLAQACDIHINTLVEREALIEGIAPSSSTTITLLIGDLIAGALAHLNKFEKEDYAVRHPGGSLGKKLAFKVKDHMRTQIPKVKMNESLLNTLMRISEGKRGLVVVFDGEDYVGLITDGDIRRTLEKEQNLEVTAVDIMSRTPKSISEDAIAYEALDLMEDNKITSLLVLNKKNKLSGIIHIHDILK